MQNSQLLGKYVVGSKYCPKTTSYFPGSNYCLKTTSQVIDNNLSDYLTKSKYGIVLQTALYQQNCFFFKFQKGGFDFQNLLLGAPLYQGVM